MDKEWTELKEFLKQAEAVADQLTGDKRDMFRLVQIEMRYLETQKRKRVRDGEAMRDV